ncbi:MAG: ATP:cob(I)alamin adenosyltransferase, partial [Burkholderiales bacterium]
MGHRLSKITTRTGDAGETGLGDGSRVSKASARIAALGEVDELNSAIGVLLAEEIPAEIRAALLGIQHDLFDLGGEVSIPGHAMVTEAQVGELERLLERFNRDLPPLRE